MMTNNKILTVSYGTFSCTLEGFDDSFGTMKAIAEYFRDLAADDRYFGAEPPQPDADMLARIAEREISRRVAAREQEGRIVLSAAPAQPADTADTTASALPVADVAASQTAVPAGDADVAEQQDVPMASLAGADTAELPADESSEAPTNDAADAPADDLAEDVAEDDTDEILAAVAQQEDSANTGDTAPAQAGVLAAGAAAAASSSESIADKLQRIRAVVSQKTDAGADTPMFEDEHAEPFAPQDESTDSADTGIAAQPENEAEDDTETESLLAGVVADFEAEPPARDALDNGADAAQPDFVEEEDDDDDIAAILARYDTDADSADDLVRSATQEDLAEALPQDTEALIENITADEDDHNADEEASLSALIAEAADDETAGEETNENLFDAPDAAETVAETSVETPTEPRRPRVIKVKRAVIEAALSQGQIEEVADDAPHAAPPSSPPSSLSPEEEAELLAELAEVEAELPETAESEMGAPSEREETIAETDAHVPDETAESGSGTQGQDAIADADVSRLMAEADHQMEEPESSRRRNAFQTLKAAVIARNADAGLGQDTVKDDGAFRSDLASVVVPRRPAAADSDAPRSKRPSPERPAPLKLVAAQRVDAGAAQAPAAPVRPRRIQQTQEALAPEIAETPGTFADYAETMGAHSLPELLEAAASYLSFVEGRDAFSRPMLLNTVRQLEDESFSREDGLRSFGQLLRAGKIEKQNGGRFVVTEDIGYRPGEREAG